MYTHFSNLMSNLICLPSIYIYIDYINIYIAAMPIFMEPTKVYIICTARQTLNKFAKTNESPHTHHPF